MRMRKTSLMLLPNLIGKRSGGSGTVVAQVPPETPANDKINRVN
jgi:hypothetical protein